MGLMFGLLAIVGMNLPFLYAEGIFFDGRSIVLSLAGLFGGGIVAVVSAIIASIYRIWIGGAGMAVGVATIVLAALLGVIIRKGVARKWKIPGFKHLLFTAIGAHVLMLLSQLLLPLPYGIEVVAAIGPVVIILFPAVTMLIGALMILAEKRIVAEAEIREREVLYRTTLYSIGDAVILTDEQRRVKKMNPVAVLMTGWSEEEAVGEPIKNVFRIINEQTRAEVESPVDKVIENGIVVGLANHTLLISRDGREIPIADSGAPVIDDAGNVTGVVLVFQDQSLERVQQRKLEESRLKYQKLIETTHAIAWEYDIGLDRWTYLSPQVTRKLGWKPEEWISLEFWKNNIHPEDRERAFMYFMSGTEKYDDHELEYRFRTKDGQYIWMQDEVSVEADKGRPARLRGLMVDIDARKRTELALQESEEQFRKLFEDHSAVKLLIDPDDGKIVNANKAAEQFYGWSREELMKMNIDQINRLPSHRIKEEIEKVSRGELNRFEFKHQRADGFIYNVEIFASRINIKGKSYLHSIVHDVSERRKVEDRVKLLSKSVEQSPAAILITDSEEQIIYVNPIYCSLTGYSQEEMLGQSPWILNRANHVDPGIFENIRKKLRAHEDWNGEFLNTRKNGESFWEYNLISPLVDDSGRITNYIIIKQDVSIQKKLVSDLEEARNRAEENQRLKSAFLANMSHEIRTPLNGIMGFTELLTGDPDLPDDQKAEYGSIIHKSAEGLLRIINDVLDISSLESEQIKVESNLFVVNDTLRSLYGLFEKKMEDSGKKDIALTLKIPDFPVEIKADENRLNQIIINLLDNALKFTSSGEVSFGISKIEDGKVEFMVSDTGIGIDPQKGDVIFDRFSQADESISKKYGGNGLGLTIVKKLTEMMGDGVSMESKPGEGSVFRFNLPGTGN